jgi:alpha-beta hydrolase superfamily lysophospholipase
MRQEIIMPYFDGARGRVFHEAWRPAGPVRGVVLLAHGYGEHLGLYDALAQRLTADGLAVHALDCAGHGRSDGRRGVVESWDDNVADLQQLAALAADQDPGVPTGVIGHSGGAVTAALFALRSPGAAPALVLSGGPLRPIDWVEAELATGLDETEGGEPTGFLSTHPEYVHALLHDPLTWKGGFRREMLLALRDTWSELVPGLEAGLPESTVLVVHGTEDPIVPIDDARWVAGVLKSGRLVERTGDLHDVLNEHDRDEIHDVVAEFLVSSLLREVRPVG